MNISISDKSTSAAVPISGNDLELLKAHERADAPASTGHPHIPAALIFAVIVVLPMLVVSCYFCLIAAPQYASETRFLIRSSQRNATGLLSGFLRSTGFVRSQDDSEAVVEFIRSRTALTELRQNGFLDEIFARPEADFVARFPNFWRAATNEGFFKHYLRFIKISTDSGSGITKLEVRAFRADDAYNLACALLDHAERLVNRLNDQARGDAVRYAAGDVKLASARVEDAQHKITDFRNREILLDPGRQSLAALEIIAKIASEVSSDKAQLRQIEKQAPQSPRIDSLRIEIDAAEQQIERERTKIVGNDASMAPKIATYERLILDRDLAARTFESATISLESSKIEAQRQQLYLERIVEPNRPDHANYPQAFLSIALTFAICLAAYFVVHLTLLHVVERET
jgi:capsular polysaccharide transport system permease protein